MPTSNNPFTTWLNQSNQSVSDFWQAPAAYWQTVAGIMSARSQTTSQITTQAISTAQQCTQAGWPQAVGLWSQFYGQSLQQLTQLNMHTHQQRMALLQQWQNLSARNTYTPSITDFFTTSNQPFSATTPTTTQAASSYTYIPGTFIPGPRPNTSQASSAPSPANQATLPSIPAQTKLATPAIPLQTKLAQPAIPEQKQFTPPSIPQQKHLEPSIPLQTAFATPRATTQAVVASMGNAALANVVSSTANSVARSSIGATAASAAAARRSVVARRATRRSRIARTSR
jgi:hypothetical protein